ncbi:MAG: hypothetical protein QGF59_32505, partial [Pirellulaceae bacterium]|nr:hypothetical protein [Pirellulaceae bacterium]
PTQEREGEGDDTRISVLVSDLGQQQHQLASAQGEVANSLIRIYKALGGGWQIRLDGHGPYPIDDEVLPAPTPPRAGNVEVPQVLVTPDLP